MDINFDSPHSAPSLLFSDFKSKLNLPPTRGSTVDVNRFNLDGFNDFELDLGCLSRSASPSSTAPRESLSSDADALLTPSFPTSLPSPSITAPESKAINISSAKVSPTTAASVIRGSWPVFRYVGRGTPIDPTRRSQWGGYDTTEDGRLHSGTLRSASFDSAIRSPTTHCSASPEWHHVSPDSQSRPFMLPEESKIKFDVQSDPLEWDSFMQTVLQPTAVASTESDVPHSPVKQELPPLTDISVETSTLDMDLGLEAALDLGLGLGRGMNWLELGLLPSSGFDSPSVYSTPPATPRVLRPLSLDNSQTGFTPIPTQNGSFIVNGHHSKFDEKADGKSSFFETGTEAWWKKLIEKLRKLQKLLHRRKIAQSE